ncbi:WecB/TagA/CpsF family glycosyltransferase [Arthrobacter sp. Soil762]|uniref:WecB/TagA/CpsF family glycosyltransferase n=1 Tax=Arthrobacter sp. Soil762 TaxID=1736401 RepID=UPI0009E6DF44
MTPVSTVGPSLWPVGFQQFGPVSLASGTGTEAAHGLCALAQRSKGSSAVHVHLVNAYTTSLAARDRQYADLFSTGALNLPDGKPLTILSRLRRKTPRLHHVRGPQLFLDVFDVGRQYGIRHFLLGSSPEVLARLQDTLSTRYPGCDIVGIESPPYRPLSGPELELQDLRISTTTPDIVWVGLGTPKQDWEARRLAASIGATTIAVGAAFDFAAGTVKEAPKWVRLIGFEWFFRLCSQPKRLWRRYLIGNFEFLIVACRDIKDNGWSDEK